MCRDASVYGLGEAAHASLHRYICLCYSNFCLFNPQYMRNKAVFAEPMLLLVSYINSVLIRQPRSMYEAKASASL